MCKRAVDAKQEKCNNHIVKNRLWHVLPALYMGIMAVQTGHFDRILGNIGV